MTPRIGQFSSAELLHKYEKLNNQVAQQDGSKPSLDAAINDVRALKQTVVKEQREDTAAKYAKQDELVRNHPIASMFPFPGTAVAKASEPFEREVDATNAVADKTHSLFNHLLGQKHASSGRSLKEIAVALHPSGPDSPYARDADPAEIPAPVLLAAAASGKPAAHIRALSESAPAFSDANKAYLAVLGAALADKPLADILPLLGKKDDSSKVLLLASVTGRKPSEVKETLKGAQVANPAAAWTLTLAACVSGTSVKALNAEFHASREPALFLYSKLAGVPQQDLLDRVNAMRMEVPDRESVDVPPRGHLLLGVASAISNLPPDEVLSFTRDAQGYVPAPAFYEEQAAVALSRAAAGAPADTARRAGVAGFFLTPMVLDTFANG